MRWLDGAQADLARLYRFKAETDEDWAEEIRSRVEAAAASLSELSLRGTVLRGQPRALRVRHRGEVIQLRYRTSETVVWIVQVKHALEEG